MTDMSVWCWFHQNSPANNNTTTLLQLEEEPVSIGGLSHFTFNCPLASDNGSSNPFTLPDGAVLNLPQQHLRSNRIVNFTGPVNGNNIVPHGYQTAGGGGGDRLHGSAPHHLTHSAYLPSALPTATGMSLPTQHQGPPAMHTVARIDAVGTQH